MASKGRFFKVMIRDFRSELLIPPAFSRKLLSNDEEMEKVALLTTCRGSWVVGVVKCGPLFHFKEGWDEFVQNHDLNEGDFLVLDHKGSMEFDVLMFDPTACEKSLPDGSRGRPASAGQADGGCGRQLQVKRSGVKLESDSGVPQKRLMAPGKNNSHQHVKQSNKKSGRGAVSSTSGRPSFATTIRSRNLTRRYLNIPKYFWRSKEVIINSSSSIAERIITLRDPVKRMWPVKLRVEKGDRRLELGRGWVEFCQGNNLKNGDVCVFELNPDTSPHLLLDVRILPP